MGMALNVDRIRAALEARLRIIDQLETFLGSCDAWICPVFPTPAFTHRRSNAPVDVNGESMSQLEANLLHSIIFNLTGHPVVTIPIGLSGEGLPVGVQVVGQRWHEVALLEVAQLLVGRPWVPEPIRLLLRQRVTPPRQCAGRRVTSASSPAADGSSICGSGRST